MLAPELESKTRPKSQGGSGIQVKGIARSSFKLRQLRAAERSLRNRTTEVSGEVYLHDGESVNFSGVLSEISDEGCLWSETPPVASVLLGEHTLS